ncbi:MAG: hypothetical protein E3K37_03320 [Candidatus Kuenenia sp.]|nr:hypothetical protein [Candidatus Kuenenia hertensis]
MKQLVSTKLVDLKNDLIQKTVRYARVRVDRELAQGESKNEIDLVRTIAHNAFTDSCNILSRNMANNDEDITWRKTLGDDRKIIGDFACYLHCILGIYAR